MTTHSSSTRAQPLLLSAFAVLCTGALATGCESEATRKLNTMSATRSTWALELDRGASSTSAQRLEECAVTVETGPLCMVFDKGRTRGARTDCSLAARRMTLTCKEETTMSSLTLAEDGAGNLTPLGDDEFKVFSNRGGVQWSLDTKDQTFKASTMRQGKSLNASFKLGARLAHQAVACKMGLTLRKSSETCRVF